MKHLFATKHAGLVGLLDDFLTDTKSELRDAASDFDGFDGQANDKSHNVIFNHLSKCIFENKEIVLSALNDALLEGPDTKTKFRNSPTCFLFPWSA